ncbi:uncharacterized protein [Primulina huaijiensis]|uniref:uncharacterized protein n=1 Tax=Primulina huaijiensis TaxID=1492673 RepID=UPI003CC75087
MQDPYMYSHIKAQVQQQPQFPEQEQLKCPRCDSPNTKFCYYNNYNLSQPRHFCKSCKRYWTKGGALRNIPVGGGSRKNAKRSSSASSSSSNNQQSKRPAASSSLSNNRNRNRNSNNSAAGSELLPLKGEDNYGPGQFGNLMDVSGSFISLLGSTSGQYGNFLGSNLAVGDHFGGPDQGHHGLGPQVIGMASRNSNNGDGFLNIEEGGGNGLPGLAIYTPCSNFH